MKREARKQYLLFLGVLLISTQGLAVRKQALVLGSVEHTAPAVTHLRDSIYIHERPSLVEFWEVEKKKDHQSVDRHLGIFGVDERHVNLTIV